MITVVDSNNSARHGEKAGAQKMEQNEVAATTQRAMLQRLWVVERHLDADPCMQETTGEDRSFHDVQQGSRKASQLSTLQTTCYEFIDKHD